MACSKHVPVDIAVDITDENHLRLILLTKKIGLKYAKKIFHIYFPEDPVQLYNALLPYQKKLKLFPDQWQILYGTPTQGSNIDDYDLSLMLKILKLKNDPNANTLKDLQEFRNFLAHYPSKPLDSNAYRQKYQHIKQILMALGASSTEIDYFQTCQINLTGDEKQKIIEELLRDIRRGTTAPITDLVLDEVLAIVSTHIGAQWKRLAISLQIPLTKVTDIDAHLVTDEVKMNECFEQMSNNVSWADLKQKLKKLNHDDIVNNIHRNSCITVALTDASENLKKRYRSSLDKVEENLHLEDPSCSQYQYVPRQEAYVNLTLSDTRIYGDATVNSDHIFNLHNQLKKCKPVDIADVIKYDDGLVAIRGVGGIGKSTFTDNYVMQWTEKKVLLEVNQLFYLRCREIGDFTGQTVEELLLEHFPATFELITVNTLKELGKQVVIILDGFDELDTTNQSKIQEIIKQNVALGANFRICITGRPNAIQTLLLNIKRSIRPKLIDVMGFTLENIEIFINKHYNNHKDKELKISRMMNKLIENLEMKSMASIPAYLFFLCYLNDDANGLESSVTHTSLCLLTSLAIIREHHKKLQLFDESLSSISQNKDVLSIILKLAELSFCSQRDGKIILYEADLDESKTDLEECGFLCRYVSSKGQAYQFRHLIFSEFLCGLHLFLMGDAGLQLLFESETSSLLWNALPTLLSFKQGRPDDVMSNFLSEVVKLHHDKKAGLSKLSKRIRRNPAPDVQDLFKKLFKRTINMEDGDKVENAFDGDTVEIDESWILLLRCIYESQDLPPQFLIDFIISSYGGIEISITHHYQLRLVVYLFQYVKPTNFIGIRFDVENIADAELLYMKNLLSRCETITMACKFNPTVLTDITMKTNTKFHSLQRLNIFSLQPDDISLLFPLIQSLCIFNLHCSSLSVEAASILSDSIIQSRINKYLNVPFQFNITYCINEEVLIKLISCIPCTYMSAIFNTKISVNSIKQLTQEIKQATTLHEDFALRLTSCELTNNHISELSSCLPCLRMLSLVDNPDISDDGYKIIADTILQQVESNGLLKLKGLILSHLNDDHIKILLPIISHLCYLEIFESDELTIESIILIRLVIRKRSSELLLTLDEDFPIDKDLITGIFADVQQYITIRYHQKPF